MKNFDEYVHFVVGAKIAGCEIEMKYKVPNQCCFFKDYTLLWNWLELIYRIKLPDGWEYVIEDGEIAFREPKEGEWYYEDDASTVSCYSAWKAIGRTTGKAPIIKRKENK